MKYPALFVIFLLVDVGSILLARNGFFRRTLCSNLSCVRLNGIESFRLAELYTDTSSVYRALFSSKTTKLRIEALRVPAPQGERELGASIAQFAGLFEKAPAPYPGEISDRIVCDPAFVPTRYTASTNGGRLTYFIGYLNSRMTFGSCTKDQASYRGIVAFTYCPISSILLRIDLIAPTEEFVAQKEAFTQQISSLTCNR
ncbi:hypothetical protein HY031_00875 [Candidatus Gottesmanbacteria bacterium]|nr:hypothetical protein [Candidatus Gottesmanbacteria bacterium]